MTQSVFSTAPAVHAIEVDFLRRLATVDPVELHALAGDGALPDDLPVDDSAASWPLLSEVRAVTMPVYAPSHEMHPGPFVEQLEKASEEMIAAATILEQQEIEALLAALDPIDSLAKLRLTEAREKVAEIAQELQRAAGIEP